MIQELSGWVVQSTSDQLLRHGLFTTAPPYTSYPLHELGFGPQFITLHRSNWKLLSFILSTFKITLAPHGSVASVVMIVRIPNVNMVSPCRLLTRPTELRGFSDRSPQRLSMRMRFGRTSMSPVLSTVATMHTMYVMCSKGGAPGDIQLLSVPQISMGVSKRIMQSPANTSRLGPTDQSNSSVTCGFVCSVWVILQLSEGLSYVSQGSSCRRFDSRALSEMVPIGITRLVNFQGGFSCYCHCVGALPLRKTTLV